MSAPFEDTQVTPPADDINKSINEDKDDYYDGTYYSTDNYLVNTTRVLRDFSLDNILSGENPGAILDAANPNKPFAYSALSDPFIHNGQVAQAAVEILNKVNIDANSGIASPFNYTENGEIESFEVAVNDPAIRIECVIENSLAQSEIINNYTMRELVIKGRGMTLGEAESTFDEEEGPTSRDISGAKSDVFPYVARYKNTATGQETNYDVYKGTEFDKWIIIRYEPRYRKPYSRLFFNIFNTSSEGSRIIHSLELRRIIYTDTVADNATHDYTKTLLNELTDPKPNTEDTAIPLTPAEELSALAPGTPTASSGYTKIRKLNVIENTRNTPIPFKPKRFRNDVDHDDIGGINKDMRRYLDDVNNDPDVTKDIRYSDYARKGARKNTLYSRL